MLFFLHLHLRVQVCESDDVGLLSMWSDLWMYGGCMFGDALSIDRTKWILTFNLRGTAQLKAKGWLLPRSSRKSAPGCHALRCWPADNGLIKWDRNSQKSHLTPVFGQGHSDKHCFCSCLTFYLCREFYKHSAPSYQFLLLNTSTPSLLKGMCFFILETRSCTRVNAAFYSFCGRKSLIFHFFWNHVISRFQNSTSTLFHKHYTSSWFSIQVPRWPWCLLPTYKTTFFSCFPD